MTLTIVTPSHAPDFASFARLHQSILRNTDADVQHIVAVPDADVDLFASVPGGRLEVRGYRQVLAARFVSTTPLARVPGLPRGFRIAAVNLKRPWPPIRGWMLQQVVKLAVVAELDADVALLIDSDVLVVRPLEERTFRSPEGVVRLYRRPGGVTPTMSRHIGWVATARTLLNSTAEEVDSPDYISAFASWDPHLVHACVARVADVAHREWQGTIAGRLDFSEFMLYGTYVMTLAQKASRSGAHSESLCLSHWDPTPLTRQDAERFVAMAGPRDLAVHIQSNSRTPDSVLQFVADYFRGG